MKNCESSTKATMNVLLVLMWSIVSSVQAADCFLDTANNGVGDSTGGAESIGSNSRLACGSGATASGGDSTAVGSGSTSSGYRSVAVGFGTYATGAGSTTMNGVARGNYSTAVGGISRTDSFGSTTLGYGANVDATSPGTIAIGHRADIRNSARGAIAIGGDTDNAPPFIGAQSLGVQSIAIGAVAFTDVDAVGGIAIGGDVDGNGRGAQSGARNAIAIGADVVANVANTVTMGYPLLIKNLNPTDATRNLLTLSNSGPSGMRFKDNSNSTTWIFRQTNDRGVTIDSLNTIGSQEAKFFEGGNMRIRGTLTEGSSRSYKKWIKPIDNNQILEQLQSIPIHQWTYKTEKNQIKHIGPMAEDFYAAFQLGHTSEGISSLDSSGVALAAIQALNAKSNDNQNELAKLKLELSTKNEQIFALETKLSDMRKQMARVAELEKAMAYLAIGRVGE